MVLWYMFRMGFECSDVESDNIAIGVEKRNIIIIVHRCCRLKQPWPTQSNRSFLYHANYLSFLYIIFIIVDMRPIGKVHPVVDAACFDF